MKLQMSRVDEFFNLINSSKKICLVGHKSPDGDCIGSVMALYNFLLINYNDKAIRIGLDGKIPYNLVDLTISAPLLEKVEDEYYDLTVVLDCGSIDRLGIFQDVIAKSAKTVCIDHHKTNTSFADVNIIIPELSSTGELLYHILKTTGKDIDLKIAECIYIAIVTDTGKFAYSSTSSETHIVASELINLGINVSDIDNKIYNSKPFNIVKAYTECISNIEYFYNSRLGIAKLTQNIINRNKIEMNDLEGVVEFIREIKEIEVSCVLKQVDDNNTKVSLRAKNNIDVSEVCKKYDGGGHFRAAGFSINKSIEETEKIIINEFSTILGE